MSQLSKSQRLVLSTAAVRADGAVRPLPDTLAVRGRALQLMLEGLIRRGLIAERPAAQGGIPALEITPEGRTAIGSTDQARSGQDDQPVEASTLRVDDNQAGPESDAVSKGTSTVRPGTKQALLIDLLRRQDGASIAEIQHATGWQPHTARAAITGLKKKSFAVNSAPRGDGTRAYRLPPHPEHGEDIG